MADNTGINGDFYADKTNISEMKRWDILWQIHVINTKCEQPCSYDENVSESCDHILKVGLDMRKHIGMDDETFLVNQVLPYDKRSIKEILDESCQ